jgi:hypothetical protein
LYYCDYFGTLFANTAETAFIMNVKQKTLITKALLFLLLIMPALTWSQVVRQMGNTAFERGEKLNFKVYYQSLLTGKVTAGEAKIEVKDKKVMKNNRPTYHIVGTGQSKGAFNFFFKVDDRFETFIDEEGMFPWYFIRRTREGGYKKDDEVTFEQFSNMAISRNAVKRVPSNIQDIVSVFYYARTLDITGVDPGDSFPLSFFLDDSVYVSKIIFLGREQVTTESGTYNCLKFKPMVATGEVFKEPYPMQLWITDDKNRIPVLMQSAVVVGSVKMELISFEGIRNPVTALVHKEKKK